MLGDGIRPIWLHYWTAYTRKCVDIILSTRIQVIWKWLRNSIKTRSQRRRAISVCLMVCVPRCFLIWLLPKREFLLHVFGSYKKIHKIKDHNWSLNKMILKSCDPSSDTPGFSFSIILMGKVSKIQQFKIMLLQEGVNRHRRTYDRHAHHTMYANIPYQSMFGTPQATQRARTMANLYR